MDSIHEGEPALLNEGAEYGNLSYVKEVWLSEVYGLSIDVFVADG